MSLLLDQPIRRVADKGVVKDVYTSAMASLETVAEKELKLTKLESDFYKACSAARRHDIELDSIRSCLLQELLDIEENKIVTLRNEIQDIQVGENA